MISGSFAKQALRRLRHNRFAVIGAFLIVALYLAGFLAGFLSPYSPTEDEFRAFFFHPPSRLHFRLPTGTFSLRPHVAATLVTDAARRKFTETPQLYPVRFFVRGWHYTLFPGIRTDLHLFGVDPSTKIFLFGTDQSGRDIFSRALYGARISLTIGLFGVLFSSIFGLFFGGLAGYFGGKYDQIIMRVAEVLMAVPALYLVLTLGNMIPERPQETYEKLRTLLDETYGWQNSAFTFGIVATVLVLLISYYAHKRRTRTSWMLSGVVLAAALLGKPIGMLFLNAADTLLPGTTRLSQEWKYFLLILILSTVGWAAMARVIRGMVFSLREQEYVTAARAIGASHWRILVRHILPATTGYVIVRATLLVPAYVLAEVALSFLGLGIQEPVPSWGNMLSAAQNVQVLEAYTWILAPGVFLFLTVLAFNFFGDGLRDALDPKST